MTELYRGLASLYEQVGDPELRGLAIEKALENKPTMPICILLPLGPIHTERHELLYFRYFTTKPHLSFSQRT